MKINTFEDQRAVCSDCDSNDIDIDFVEVSEDEIDMNEFTDDELLDELKSRGFSTVDRDTQGSDLKRHLCDIVGVNYHTELSGVLNAIVQKIDNKTAILELAPKDLNTVRQSVDNSSLKSILQELEYAETTKSVVDYEYHGGSAEDIKKELIQTAAMCLRMLENLDNTIKATLEKAV